MQLEILTREDMNNFKSEILAEIRQMTNELFAQHQDYLPQFKHYTV